MVIARRLRERQLEKAREEGRRQGLEEGRKERLREVDAQWEAWLGRMREAEKEGREFTEPAPSEKDASQP